ncbi:MAG: hypothetical protein KU37_11840 [Sulfuricurvum sp. PC08-66]|nr:MAG: hypothetical protein KU37_11840 [Sulfuricurvum sp. PC08-66]
MSHRFYEGVIYHRRFVPKMHTFSYRFFLLDIDVAYIDCLSHRFFGYEKGNLFSFTARDHFGASDDFATNVAALLEAHALPKPTSIRYITLPRIAGFVFNPASFLILLEGQTPTQMFVQVHNYNGGRILYPVTLRGATHGGVYTGKVPKEMHVSPFFARDGEYTFTLQYSPSALRINIEYSRDGVCQLVAAFNGDALPFTSRTVTALFARHTFLTLWVVTRTLWQSWKLWRKGLAWHTPNALDTTKRS